MNGDDGECNVECASDGECCLEPTNDVEDGDGGSWLTNGGNTGAEVEEDVNADNDVKDFECG
jgi:hypothetical protein